MLPLRNEDRRALLSLARWAIVEAVCHARVPEIPKPTDALAHPCGAFVTLHHHGRLRGCIGQAEAVDSLARTVACCAVSAALHDPRFRPLHAEELADLEIEISILSPLQVIRPEEIRVGVHGLVVTREKMRGVLLPQVAIEQSWGPHRLLEETCVKAGLGREAWKDPATRIEAFTADVFAETELGPKKQAQAS